MALAKAKRASLSASDWTSAALEALAQGGLAAVAVEPIAKVLGTTKGSFYWHFTGRDELLQATLDLWEQRDTDRIIAAIDRDQEVSARLRNLLHRAFRAVRDEPGAGAVELALQPTAEHSLVAPVLARVTERRMLLMTELFTEMGMSPTQARGRALLAYTAYLGHAQLAHATPDQMPTEQAFAVHVDQMVETLMSETTARKRSRSS